MARFALLELIITAAVLYVIYRVTVWIVRMVKKNLDKVDEEITKESDSDGKKG